LPLSAPYACTSLLFHSFLSYPSPPPIIPPGCFSTRHGPYFLSTHPLHFRLAASAAYR
jgi:hypothetical protein